MTFDEWFSSQQGKPYYGMYSFAQAAWSAATSQMETQLAVAAEREACAKLCEEIRHPWGIQYAIRARKENIL